MAKNDGGPAFPPVVVRVYGEGQGEVLQNTGMSLRDWFAGQALVGFCANAEAADWTPEMSAQFAFEQADAMLAAREDN